MESILSSTRRDIQHLTSTLKTERLIKHNLQEYNALARLGNISHTTTTPPICVTKLELEQVQRTIHDVKQDIKQAQLEIMVREKQLRVVMASLGDLRSTLLEEEELKKRRQRQEAEEAERSPESTEGGTTLQKKRKRGIDDEGVVQLNRSDDDDENDIGAL